VIIEKLYDDLVRDEGKKLLAYKDTQGYWTIGVGHLLGDKMRMCEITEAECRALFDYDVQVAQDAARRVLDPTNLWWIIDDVRQRAMVNMAFNRGEARMRDSTTITPAIRAAIQGMYDPVAAWKKVADAIRASQWAQQIGNRAARLAYMFETGKDPA
jgi:lysozyme